MYRSSSCETSGQLTDVPTGGYYFQLMFTKIFLTKVMPNNSSGCFFIQQCLAHIPRTFPVFAFDSHNVQIYCVKGKWHNRRYLYYIVRTATRAWVL